MAAHVLNTLTHPPLNGGKPKKLVVLLHGLGANGEDLLGLAPYWARALPDVQFYAPDAPEPCDMAPMGFQWFSLLDRSRAAMRAGVEKATPILNQFLDEVLEEHGLDDSALALVGFSQGTMMSLHVAPRRANPVAGVVGFSGMLLGGPEIAAEVVSRPPMLLIHGTADEVVSFDAMAQAEMALQAANISVETVSRPNLGHGIDDLGLIKAGQFLTSKLG